MANPWDKKTRKKGAGALNAAEHALTDPVGTILGSAGKAAKKIAKEVGDALGIGTGADQAKYDRRRGWYRNLVRLTDYPAQEGNRVAGDATGRIHYLPALQVLRAIGGIEPLPLTYTAQSDPALFETDLSDQPRIEVKYLPAGWMATLPGHWGKAYDKIVNRAKEKALVISHTAETEGWRWLRGNGTAGGSGAGSDAGTSSGPTSTTPTPSVPSAPPSGTGNSPSGKPKACTPAPDGTPRERDPVTGRCRKVKASGGGSWLGPGSGGTAAPVAGGGPKPCPPGKERNPVTGRCVNPCVYGPRGADGKCPRKQSSALNKNEKAQVAKATKAAEKIVEAGAVGAAKAIRAGLKAAGVPLGQAVGTTLAVVGAAIAGWFIGRAFDDWVQNNDLAAVKAKASLRLQHARVALAKELGVYDVNAPGIGLSLAQQSAITKAWKDSIATIEQTAYRASQGQTVERPGA